MIVDTDIKNKIEIIKQNVNEINQLMAELHEQNVEIRIGYIDAAKGVVKEE